MRIFHFAMLCFMLCSLNQVIAEDVDGGTDAPDKVKIAIELARKEATSLQLYQGSQPLKLEPKPLLRWNNPVSGDIYGDVYIWTLDGRPEAIVSIYKWFSPHTHMGTELQSLSEKPLVLKRDEVPVWTPGPGITMKPLSDSPTPHPSALQRNRQMRSIAEQFRAQAEDRSDPESRWNLRALPKPIFRYTSEKQGVVDGAMFAFCQGNTNNPEVLLLLEAKSNEGKMSWFYGLGRQNSLRFLVHRNEKLIWDVPRLAPPWPILSDPTKPYMVMKK